VGRQTWYHVRAKNQITSYGQPEFNYELRTNSLGLRDIEHSVEKPSDHFRIITIGDSYTEGQGADYESSYPKILEKILNSKTQIMTFEIINGGVAGSDPFYGFKLLQDKLLKFKPDLVTLDINNTDITDTIVRGGMERFLLDGNVQYVEAPTDEWLFSRSHLYRGITMALLGYNWLGLSRSERKRKKIEAIMKLESALTDYQNLASREEFKFLVIIHPTGSELRKKRYNIDAERLKAYMKNSSIPFVDIMGYLSQYAHSNEEIEALFWAKDRHPNADGYRKFAEGIEAYLHESHLIPNNQLP
jgi:lysophospholipase L1-like esterase